MDGQGNPGYRVESWYGIYAPAGTHPDEPKLCTAPLLVTKSLFDEPVSAVSVTVGKVALGSVVSSV